MKQSHKVLANVALFQMAWFAGALYTSSAVLFMLLCLIVNLTIGKFNPRDLVLVVVGVMGFMCDLAFVKLGLLDVALSPFPFWLMLIWCLFTLSLNYSLAFVAALKPYWVFLLGAVFGPLSYFGAGKLGALIYPSDLSLIMIHSVFWGVTFFMLSVILKRLHLVKTN